MRRGTMTGSMEKETKRKANEELDSLLQVIENPVRRKIIKRLSQEPGYALQLSKELGLGQPLVAKHLGIMEDAGLVTSTYETSSSGPNRKRYSLAKSISIILDVAPNLFIERTVPFDSSALASTPSSSSSSSHSGEEKSETTARLLREQVRQAIRGDDDRTKLALLSSILEKVDSTMDGMDQERAELLEVRDRAMREAALIATKMELDKKRVLFHILDVHDRGAESISESLNLREIAVRRILEELEREFFS